MVNSPLRSITEADADTSNCKREEQDLVRSCVTSNICCKSVILLNLPLDNKSPDVGLVNARFYLNNIAFYEYHLTWIKVKLWVLFVGNKITIHQLSLAVIESQFNFTSAMFPSLLCPLQWLNFALCLFGLFFYLRPRHRFQMLLSFCSLFHLI